MSDVDTDKPSAVPGTFGMVAPAASAVKASASSSSPAVVKLSADKEAAVMAVFDGKHQAIDISRIVYAIDVSARALVFCGRHASERFEN